MEYFGGVIDEIDSCEIIGYTPEDSCVSTLCGRVKINSTINKMVLFKDIFTRDYNLKKKTVKKVKNEKETFIETDEPYCNLETPFAKACGLTSEYVRIVCMVYLSGHPVHLADTIYNSYGVDLVYLSWMIWHDCSPIMHQHACGKNVNHKRNDHRFCAICNATENFIKSDTGEILTISPAVMSGNRFPQSFGLKGDIFDTEPYGRHYVIWSKSHSDTQIPERNIQQIKQDKGSGFTYVHGKYQYGHPHVHVISYGYHDTRALEILKFCQDRVLHDQKIEWSDFYHPIKDFYANCSPIGRTHITTSFMIKRLRLKIPLEVIGIDDLAQYYKLAYNTFWHDIISILDTDTGSSSNEELEI